MRRTVLKTTGGTEQAVENHVNALYNRGNRAFVEQSVINTASGFRHYCSQKCIGEREETSRDNYE